MKKSCCYLWLLLCCFLCPVLSAGVMVYADADGFSDGTDISNAFSGMTLSSVGSADGLDGKVYAKTDSYASTGTMVFGNNLASPTLWYLDAHPTPQHPDDYALRIDFDAPAKYAAIDAIGQGDNGDGVIEAYNSLGGLIYADFIGLLVRHSLTDGEIVHIEINCSSYDIAYILIGGRFLDDRHIATPIHLDNLSAEISPEPATMALLGLGAVLAGRRRKRVKN